MARSMTRRDHLAALLSGAALGAGMRPAAAQSVPWSSGTERPTLAVPPDATDCHHHIYDARFPVAPGATLRPPDATVEDYRQLQRRLGLTRHVVVQPSTYGTDNRLLVQSLKEFGPTARGIAMLDASVTADELKRLDAAGIRGVRFGTRLPGGAPITDMVPVARKIADLGWHIQLVSDGDKIVELADTLKGMPVPVVFDHMGHLPEPAGPDHPGFRVIADLIEKNGAWVKLTGAYILSKVGPPTYADRGRLARAYVALAPERLVWGSDWPHPTAPSDGKPDDAVLLDLLAEWAPDEGSRKRILVDNPGRLYGFA
ncbi:amidohydrolase family protein [Methylobacterium pseudosasicola]|uniref:Predicted metal-dependent hydrolase, TIM-barrel fold n=1 Tax=Methylobacterium pseudosasicola TaxID=582667 RepID=A0A1I4R4Y1_9HYPH|nr:amidohydrolase family protein [Methylobacterium pseudosasicola]SFM47321.1 Predicted metal-dependent hydrolase, TIM-barrel fold [Methylobacterium pseudosasicola]